MRLKHVVFFICLCLCTAAARCGNGDALRRIVQEQCVPEWREHQDPKPCLTVALPGAPSLVGGYGLLHDRKGGSHYLLITTETISGIESPELLRSGEPNYFAAAWEARSLIAAEVGHELPRNAVGLAINPPHARTQGQFHIHIECVRPDIAATLASEQGLFSANWRALPLGGWAYHARRLSGATLLDDPIRDLAAQIPEAGHPIGDYTLVIVGMQFDDGPGFLQLVSRDSAGELLLDSTCAADRAAQH